MEVVERWRHHRWQAPTTRAGSFIRQLLARRRQSRCSRSSWEVFAEQTTPPTLPTKEPEAVVPAVIENPVPVAAQAGGSATEVSATDAMCAINFEVINLDTPYLSSNDRDIYEAVLESMLANPVELGVEAPESVAPAAASSDEAVAPVGGSPRWVPPRRGSFRRSKLETLEVPCAQPHRRQ
jgi:hypothetical protein